MVTLPRAGIYLLDGVLIKSAVRDSHVRVGIDNGRSCVGVLLGYRHGGVGGVVISNGLRKACTFSVDAFSAVILVAAVLAASPGVAQRRRARRTGRPALLRKP